MTPRFFNVSLGALLVASSVSAQDAEVVNGQQFGGWVVSCEATGVNRTACILSQTLTREGDGAFIAQVMAFWSGDGAASFLAARVPMGVYLPTGFILQGEDAEEGVPFIWQTCTGQVCEALRQADEGLLRTLAVDNETVVGQFQPRLDMEPFLFRFSMAGVIEGLEALRPGG